MSTAPNPLPSLPAIFRGIKAGHHWCFGDPEYGDLNEWFEEYKAFFALITLTLHRDGRGFIYATSNEEDYKGSDQITRFVVFTAVWVDAVADEGGDIGERLFAENQHVGDLPHLNGDANRRLLAQVGVTAPDDLHATLKSMERLGLSDVDGHGRFSMRPSFYRLLDVCLDAGRRAEAAPPAGEANMPTNPAEDSP